MAGRSAAITQADVRRVIRAAKQEGVEQVEVHVGEQAKIVIRLSQSTEADGPLEPPQEIVL